MGFWLYFFIYGGRANRHCFGQLLNRYCVARHVLRRCAFSLRFKDRGSFCFNRGFSFLISFNNGADLKGSSAKNPVLCYIFGREFNFFPDALFRAGRHASTIL